MLRVAAVAVVLLSIPAAARASCGNPTDPSPVNSSIGKVVLLAPYAVTGGYDQCVTTTMVIRDGLGNPVPSPVVTIDFSACAAADIRVAATQPDGSAVLCPIPQVTKVGLPTGVVVFHLSGYALNPGGGIPGSPAPGFGPGGAKVFANGCLLGTVSVAAFDQNGIGGSNAVDLSLFLNDRFSGMALPSLDRGRSDYNGDGVVNVVDLSLWLSHQACSQGGFSSLPGCP
jgi:hypothetical protein